MAVLGYNTIGGTNFQWNNFHSTEFTATEDGQFTDLNAYFALTGAGNYKMCIWDTSGNLLFESVADTANTTPGWKSRPCTYSFTNGQVMRIGIIADDWFSLYGDTGATGQFTDYTLEANGTNYAAGAPDPAVVNNQYAVITSIYGNYTPSGGAPDTSKMLMLF